METGVGSTAVSRTSNATSSTITEKKKFYQTGRSLYHENFASTDLIQFYRYTNIHHWFITFRNC